jgi:hypothetical protein
MKQTAGLLNAAAAPLLLLGPAEGYAGRLARSWQRQ